MLAFYQYLESTPEGSKLAGGSTAEIVEAYQQGSTAGEISKRLTMLLYIVYYP